MTETAKKTAAPGKKPAVKAKAATPAKKVSASKSQPASKTGAFVTVKQIGSSARTQEWAYATLAGLGLGKLNRTSTLEDTPAVRGMIRRVHHLVTIVEAA